MKVTEWSQNGIKLSKKVVTVKIKYELELFIDEQKRIFLYIATNKNCLDRMFTLRVVRPKILRV